MLHPVIDQIWHLNYNENRLDQLLATFLIESRIGFFQCKNVTVVTECKRQRHFLSPCTFQMCGNSPGTALQESHQSPLSSG